MAHHAPTPLDAFRFDTDEKINKRLAAAIARYWAARGIDANVSIVRVHIRFGTRTFGIRSALPSRAGGKHNRGRP